MAEAMYYYTPAVTFTIPGNGVNWVSLNGVTGIECPNGDAVAFAAAIDKLLSDDALAKKYAEAAHQRVVENFTIPKMMEKMNEVYNGMDANTLNINMLNKNTSHNLSRKVIVLPDLIYRRKAA